MLIRDGAKAERPAEAPYPGAFRSVTADAAGEETPVEETAVDAAEESAVSDAPAEAAGDAPADEVSADAPADNGEQKD